MKKVTISILTLALFFFSPVLAHAQMGWGMMGNYNNPDASNSSLVEQENQQKLQDMVQSLLKSQNVSQVKDLNCSKIPRNQLIKLGDAWMDVQIPNEQVHEAMDNMMGGEGSQSLNESHTQMAERYLGCSGTSTNFSWMPMMQGYAWYNGSAGGIGFPMINPLYTMMGYRGFGGLLFGLLGLVGFVDAVLLGVYLYKKVRESSVAKTHSVKRK